MRIFQLQRYTAIALLFFFVVHWVFLHYVSGPDLSVEVVLQRLNNPVWKAIDILFLFTVLIHALTGAYMVLTDIQRVSVFRRALAIASVVLGVAAFIYGSISIYNFRPPM